MHVPIWGLITLKHNYFLSKSANLTIADMPDAF